MTWNEQYWPLIIQLYRRKPEGVKAMYARDTVQLALELHLPPEVIYERMFQLRQPARPSLRRLSDSLSDTPRHLQRVCRVIRNMEGMGHASVFFDDVPVVETWERDFRPVNARTAQMMGRPLFTPVMLVMILDLYFRLIPDTMVAATPEVRDLARLMDIRATDVEDVLRVFQYCDPMLTKDDTLFDPMLPPCSDIWQRYATGNAATLSNLAHQLRAYWE